MPASGGAAANAPPWLAALGQVFLGLLLGVGALLALAALIYAGTALLAALGIGAALSFAAALAVAAVILAVGFVALEFSERMQAFRARRGEPGVGEWLLIAGLSLASLTGIPQIIEALRGAQLVSEQPLSEGERWRLGLGGMVQLAVALAGVRVVRSLGRRGSGSALPPRTLASRIISEGRQIRGHFPRTASANEMLYRADTHGRITHYQVYGADGLPVMRADVTGKPHGGVATPHVIEFQRHRAPDGTIYVRPSRTARPACADEIP